MKIKIIQLTAAKGPAECAWVVAKVLKYLIAALKNNSIDYRVLHKENGAENGTVRSVILELKGKDLAQFLKGWTGTIQWVGKSKFRKHHKRKNWFIGCFELDNFNTIALHPQDVKYSAIRSSGPGGQHVNKVSSAIRALHLPTGVQVVAQDSRSQHQNKKIAYQRLQEKLNEFATEQMQEQSKNQWGNHLQLERGNPVRVFTGSDFKIQKKVKTYKKKRGDLKNDLRKEMKGN